MLFVCVSFINVMLRLKMEFRLSLIVNCQLDPMVWNIMCTDQIYLGFGIQITRYYLIRLIIINYLRGTLHLTDSTRPSFKPLKFAAATKLGGKTPLKK